MRSDSVHSLDSEIVQQIVHWLGQSQQVWLCTVIRSWGSSPRPPGSLWACNQQGEVCGSLSGGCIEDDLLQRLMAGEFNSARCHRYGDDNDQLQLPCGGVLEVLIEPLSSEHLQVMQQLAQALMAQQVIARLCEWPGHKMQAQTAQPPAKISLQQQGDQPLRLHQVYAPATHLLLIGAGAVSIEVARFGLALGYKVSVCDPQPQRRQQWPVPAVTLLADMPDDAVLAYADDPLLAILALSHDPRLDDMALMVAFKTAAFYIGAMGSQRSSSARRERLLQLGVSQSELNRLRAPIGLDIGSKTPGQIAIAIMAELIAQQSATATA